MRIFDAICACVASSGHRRGAQMGVMRIDHPDIVEFIHAKQNTDQLREFNLSVAVTDRFMRALERDEMFPLRWNGQSFGEIDPRYLWEKLMRSTWDWAEPGVLFIDTINRANNLRYCETIAACNPCGEQPLPPFGACILGSFNLVRYVREGAFDFQQLHRDIPHIVRAMDNVIDRGVFPLPEQEEEAKAKRRMGLGVTGVANAIESLGCPYGSPGFLQMLAKILTCIRDKAYKASCELATEKGAFPLFRSSYGGEFFQTLPQALQRRIKRDGIRNSHLLSIAPTGTISMCADNISSGIEPVVAYEVERTVNEADGPRTVTLQDYGFRHGVRGKTIADVTIEEHLAVLLTAQRYVDSAISKTCNVPADTPWKEFQELYVQAWKGGAKGCATYTWGGKRPGVINPTLTCEVDPATGRKTCE
jgi:ribonucleoside-diphosphate reductase alpha chain